MRQKRGQGVALRGKILLGIWLLLLLAAMPYVFPASKKQEDRKSIASIIANQSRISSKETKSMGEDTVETGIGDVEWNFQRENKEMLEELKRKKQEENWAKEKEAIPYSGNFRKDVLKKYEKENLKDYDYLVEHFIHVDATTRLLRSRMNFQKLFYLDLSVKKKEDPVVLIYHTHSQEGYKSSKKSHGKTVVDVGDELTRLLQEKYGISVLHHKGEYDKKSRDTAYSKALPAIKEILKEYPSIQVVIDLHRDGVGENTHLVTKIGEKKMAQIMFFNGVSHSKVRGELSYLKNDNLKENLALSLQMQLAARTYFPTLTRNVYIKGYRYNMHLRGRSLLVEVGAQTNTFEEARNAMEPLALLLSRILIKDK